MAYTNPNTGVTRDKYGKEVRDPTGTDPHSHNNYMWWGVGALFAVALLFAVFGATNEANAPIAHGTSMEQPVTPKPPASSTP
jgi:hypothetical protein